MDDPVGDVLAQRAALDTGAGTGIVLSIAFHAGATALAVYVALHQPPPEMVNTLTIRFAPSKSISRPAAVQPAAKPAAPKLQEALPVIEQPKPVAVPPASPKTTAPPSPFGRSTKNPGVVQPPPPPAIAPGAESAADIAVGTSGVTGLEGGDFPYTVYIENMKRLIGTRWFRPQGSGVTTTVYFAIDRDGSIRDCRTESASGNGGFDRAAMRAVLETSPLPPLPVTYNGSYLGVHLTFK